VPQQLLGISQVCTAFQLNETPTLCTVVFPSLASLLLFLNFLFQPSIDKSLGRDFLGLSNFLSFHNSYADLSNSLIRDVKQC